MRAHDRATSVCTQASVRGQTRLVGEPFEVGPRDERVAVPEKKRVWVDACVEACARACERAWRINDAANRSYYCGSTMALTVHIIVD